VPIVTQDLDLDDALKRYELVRFICAAMDLANNAFHDERNSSLRDDHHNEPIEPEGFTRLSNVQRDGSQPYYLFELRHVSTYTD